jgi:hypothetical protein
MRYPWHPFFGKTFDIQLHFSRAQIEAYRCCPSDLTEQRKFDIPVWMFDSVRCSQMKLLSKPYCSLDSLNQLRLLLSEVSPLECIISQTENTFNIKGDANAKSRPATQNSGPASFSSSRSSSNDMGKSIQTTIGTIDQVNEQDANGVSKSSERT